MALILFIFYLDSTQGLNFSEFPSIKPVVRQAVPETFRKAYRKQLDNPGYQNLLRTNITVFGCLDDHDYGVNNGDRTYPYAREGALSFLKVCFLFCFLDFLLRIPVRHFASS